MDSRNRLGLHGAYALATAGIGFTLPYLPLYLSQRKLSDSAIALISTLAALSALLQFPIGVWSDRVGLRKPFILAALIALTAATIALPLVGEITWLALAVVLFAENGICRAVIESQTGAAAVALACSDQVGSALGRLRFWKPIGIIAVALVGGRIVEYTGLDFMLIPLAVASAIASALVLLVREPAAVPASEPLASAATTTARLGSWHDRGLWSFIVAMVLFHAANAPAGVYLGLFLSKELGAGAHQLADAFVVSMIAWMIVSRPAGMLADRFGRRPLLIVGWVVMTLRLFLISIARTPEEIIAIQALDGFANGLFAILAAAWTTDRMGGASHAGRAQAVVGTSLVLGSAVGPAASALIITELGYRGLFMALGVAGAVATGILITLVPETLKHPGPSSRDESIEAAASAEAVSS